MTDILLVDENGDLIVDESGEAIIVGEFGAEGSLRWCVKSVQPKAYTEAALSFASSVTPKYYNEVTTCTT